VIDDARGGGDAASAGSGGGRRRSGAIDLSLDGVVTQGGERGSLVFADMDVTPVKTDVEELEGGSRMTRTIPRGTRRWVRR